MVEQLIQLLFWNKNFGKAQYAFDILQENYPNLDKKNKPFGFKRSEEPSSYMTARNAKDATPGRAESEQQAREYKTDGANMWFQQVQKDGAVAGSRESTD